MISTIFRSVGNMFSTATRSFASKTHFPIFQTVAAIAAIAGAGIFLYGRLSSPQPQNEPLNERALSIRILNRKEHAQISSVVSDWQKQAPFCGKQIYRDMARELRDPDSEVKGIVAFDETGKAQGALTFYKVGDQYLLVSHLATAPWNLGKFGAFRGVGTSLLARVVREALEKGNRLKNPYPIQLGTYNSSKSFYEKRYFEVRELQGYLAKENLAPFLNQFAGRATQVN